MRVKSVLLTLLKLAVSGGLLALIFYKTPLEDVRTALATLHWPTYLLGIFIYMCSVPLAAYRWQHVAKTLGFSQADFYFYLKSYFRGLFVGQALPSGVGGDVLRAADMVQQGCTVKKSACAVLYDRMAGFMGLVFIALFFLPTLVFILPPALGFMLAVVVLALSCACVLLFVFTALPIMPYTQWMRRISADMQQCYVATSWVFIQQTLLAVSIQVAIVLLFACCIAALGFAVPWAAAFTLLPLVLLLAVVPISLAGWGVREGAVVGLFTAAGVLTAPQALTASILLGLGLLVGSLPGLYFVLRGVKKHG